MSLIKYQNRITQQIANIPKKPPLDYDGLAKRDKLTDKIIYQPMDIDRIDPVEGGFDVFGYKGLRSSGFSQGEYITSFTISQFQQNLNNTGLYIKVYHDTRSWEIIDDEKAYIGEIYSGTDIVEEYEYGSFSVADLRKERPGTGESFKLDYVLQGKHKGNLLIGVYAPNPYELTQARLFTDKMQVSGIETYLMNMPATALNNNGEVSCQDIWIPEIYHHGIWHKRNQRLLVVQDAYWNWSEKQASNSEFQRVRNFGFDKYKEDERGKYVCKN